MLVKGTVKWAKILGEPILNKLTSKNQWSVDFYPDEESQEKLLTGGMRKSYLRDKGDGNFITFTRDEIKKNGEKGTPYRVVDAHNEPWDQTKLIGNGSEVNAVVQLNEISFRGEKWLKPSLIALQIWNHVEFQSKNGGFPVAEKETVEGEQPSSDKW